MMGDARARPEVIQACCDVHEGCITCGDVAVELMVLTVDGPDAVCADERGRTESVACELVAGVAVGDRLLVHAGVALERLEGRERNAIR
jgi:hydrogenase maturation factor